MRTDKKSTLGRYGAVTLLVIASMGLGGWHGSRIQQGKQDIVAGMVRAVLAPPTSVLNHVSGWVGSQTGWVFRGRTLAQENERLKQRLAEMEAENARLREAQIAYDRLRLDLHFVQSLKKPPIAADVWSRRPDPKYDTIIISRGSRDGIQPHDLVITRAGVVGYVAEADPMTSTVVLLTDQNSTFGARIQRANSRAVGLCRGNNGPLLSMTELDHEADVKPGDLVVTSGLSRLYPKTLEGTPPRDLIIGVVEKVKPDPVSAGKTALVRPEVDYDRLEEVYVLR